MAFYLKTGDLKPHLTSTLSGGPADWSGASAEIVIRRVGSATVFTASVTLDDAAKTVEYDWTGFDTTVAGDYQYEWLVTFPDGDEMTAPGKGVLGFKIISALDT